MRLRKTVSVVVAIAAALPSPASAFGYQPQGPWNLDVGDAACTAARQYGTAASPVVFAIVPSITGGSYEVVVNLPRSGPSAAEESAGSLNFGKHGIGTSVLHYGDRNAHTDVYKYALSPADLESGSAATSVELHTGRGSSFEFALTDMSAIITALKTCTADLQNYWNLVPSRSTRLSRSAKPVTDVRTVFKGTDYPTAAIFKGQEGTAQYILMIDEKGAVAGCDLNRRSGVPVLDAMGCAVLQERAKFAPALDAQGKPARDTYTTPPVTWRMM